MFFLYLITTKQIVSSRIPEVPELGLFKGVINFLCIESYLPPSMCLCLSSTSNKENLIEIISGKLFERFAANACSNRLVITSKNEVPEEVHFGVRIERHDLATNFDEAEYIIAQQVNSTVRQGEKQVIKVVSADTDVFVFLCSNLAKNNWYSANLYMDTFTEDNKLININKSVHNNKEIIPSLIAMHALSGCDSVPMMFGIGKAKALKALKNVPLKSIGDINADLEEVMNEGFTFVANCYRQKDTNSSKK